MLEVLGLSENQAFYRIHAAKLARRFAVIFELLEKKQVHLTPLSLLRDYITEENHVALLREVSGKTKVQILERLAALAPRPDVPSRLRKLVPQPNAVAAGPTGSLEPLSLATYRLQLNTSGTLKMKLELAAKLMTHSNPSGDLAIVVEKALDLLLEKLEKERFAKTARPRPRAVKSEKPHTATRRREHIPNEVVRQLVERDGRGCSYVGDDGHRCGEQAFLQVHHEEAWAKGGSDEVHNLRLLCASHNRFLAERDFGSAHVARTIARRRSALPEPH